MVEPGRDLVRVITKQAICRGAFTSANALIAQVRAYIEPYIESYIEHWNTRAHLIVWTAGADEILAKVGLVQADIRKLVGNDGR